MQEKLEHIILKYCKEPHLQRFMLFLLNHTFFKFCFVGGIATILNYGLFYILFTFGFHYLLSAASGYILGVVIGFILNKILTFQSSSKKYAVEITKYLMVYTFTLFLGLGILQLLVWSGLHPLLANLLVLIPTTISNYLGCKWFVFDQNLRSRINFLIYRYKYLLRYIIIGLGSIVVEVLVIHLFSLSPSTKNLHTAWFLGIGFLCGVLFSFYLNSTINFPVPKEHNLRTFRMFLLISLFAFFLNLILMRYVFYSFFDYTFMRFITAALVFMISYTLHRKFTFTDVKEVGVAIYLTKSENIKDIKEKIATYPDFIHIDLVDKTYFPDAEEVDVSVGKQIQYHWPTLKKMVHIMSEYPSGWIKKVHDFTDIIVFHLEIKESVDDMIKLCKFYNKQAGIAILYNTKVDDLVPYLSKIDVVQVLGIPQPGYSNQKLQAPALEKLEVLNTLRKKYHFDLCFDGGVKLTNIRKINARYIVSGSTVLKADDAVSALYTLKTNSRYYEQSEYDLKKALQKEIQLVLSSTDSIVSGTIVGSFPHSSGLEGISDIDIIVLVDTLTKSVFDTIVSRFEALRDSLKVDYDYNLIINTTFGPLKYNAEKTVVFHLMIYDKEGHKQHCIKSPFTCLDWQHADTIVKKSMSSIYSVTYLQPNHFFNARRSVSDYLKDLKEGVISYREYSFDKKGKFFEEKKNKKMNDKDKFEFAYHIIKFCMLNCIKLYRGEYRTYSLQEIIQHYFLLFPKEKEQYSEFILSLRDMKTVNKYPLWGEKHENMLQSFLQDFETQFKTLFDTGATHFYFIRHASTTLNKPGVFLGQHQDPDIAPVDNKTINHLHSFIKEKKISIFFSSPLKRTQQTLAALKKTNKITRTILDDNLLEINYGKLEGKNTTYLKKSYPQLIEAWKMHQDPAFPDGESTKDVSERVKKFLNTIPDKENALICTHNVFLRCLIGKQCNIPQHQWHALVIPHLSPLEIIKTREGKYYINLTQEQYNIIFENITFEDT